MQVDELLKLMVDKGASDLHLTVPSPPVLRIEGMLLPQEDLPTLTAKDIQFALEQISTEIMLATSVIRRLIREEKIYEIPPNIEMGKLEGTQTMEQALADLVEGNIVTLEEAMMKSSNPTKLNSLLQSKNVASTF